MMITLTELVFKERIMNVLCMCYCAWTTKTCETFGSEAYNMDIHISASQQDRF